jgi:hypothetical protein
MRTERLNTLDIRVSGAPAGRISGGKVTIWLGLSPCLVSSVLESVSHERSVRFRTDRGSLPA